MLGNCFKRLKLILKAVAYDDMPLLTDEQREAAIKTVMNILFAKANGLVARPNARLLAAYRRHIRPLCEQNMRGWHQDNKNWYKWVPALIRGQSFIFDFNRRNIDERRSVKSYSCIPECKNTHLHNMGIDAKSFVILLNPILPVRFERNDQSFFFFLFK